jgi:thioredoxin-related protein
LFTFRGEKTFSCHYYQKRDPEANDLVKYLDRIANLAVIVAVAVFLVLVYRGNFSGHPSVASPTQDLVGRSVVLSGVRFPKNQNSLLIAVSTSCHFCQDSLPLYKQITARSKGQLNVVAVLPQSQPEATKFLRDAGVEADQVVSASLESIGVRGTPTVMLLDGNGKIQKAWVGRLDEKRKKELLQDVLPDARS